MKNSKLLLLTAVLLLTLTGCRTRTTVPVDPIPDENGEAVLNGFAKEFHHP